MYLKLAINDHVWEWGKIPPIDREAGFPTPSDSPSPSLSPSPSPSGAPEPETTLDACEVAYWNEERDQTQADLIVGADIQVELNNTGDFIEIWPDDGTPDQYFYRRGTVRRVVVRRALPSEFTDLADLDDLA
jgi:hypothetical protein